MSLQETPVSRDVRNASGGSRHARKANSERFALQEEVHRQIASELHDSTCQQFAARTPLNIEVLLRANEMARLEMLLKRRAHSSSRFSCDKIIGAALS